MPLRVDIDFESHEMFIDGVQVNKTPKTIVPHDSNKKSKHPVILKIIVDFYQKSKTYIYLE